MKASSPGEDPRHAAIGWRRRYSSLNSPAVATTCWMRSPTHERSSGWMPSTKRSAAHPARRGQGRCRTCRRTALRHRRSRRDVPVPPAEAARRREGQRQPLLGHPQGVTGGPHLHVELTFTKHGRHLPRQPPQPVRLPARQALRRRGLCRSRRGCRAPARRARARGTGIEADERLPVTSGLSRVRGSAVRSGMVSRSARPACRRRPRR